MSTTDPSPRRRSATGKPSSPPRSSRTCATGCVPSSSRSPALFLAWYLLYVLCATYAPAFMSAKLWGNITVGLIFGLLQFVSTFAITIWYVRYANRRLDPLAEQLRDELEGGEP